MLMNKILRYGIEIPGTNKCCKIFCSRKLFSEYVVDWKYKTKTEKEKLNQKLDFKMRILFVLSPNCLLLISFASGFATNRHKRFTKVSYLYLTICSQGTRLTTKRNVCLKRALNDKTKSKKKNNNNKQKQYCVTT